MCLIGRGLEMPRLLTILFFAAVVAGAAFAMHPAKAHEEAPWCAVVDTGFGNLASNCSFWTFEACVPHVLTGNRGFCEENPYFNGPVERRPAHLSPRACRR
jgi:hypothetical protein